MKSFKSVNKIIIILAGLLLLIPIYSFADSATNSYDGAGRLISVSYDSGTVISYTYDNAGNVTQNQALANAQSGSLQFDSAAYAGNAGEDATFTVTRTDGTDGAVSVQYATSDGTASADTDYTAASGTLNWADGDSASKTFTVTILADAPASATINITLSSPSGGATLGTYATAVFTVTSASSGGGGGGGGCFIAAASYEDNANISIIDRIIGRYIKNWF